MTDRGCGTRRRRSRRSGCRLTRRREACGRHRVEGTTSHGEGGSVHGGEGGRGDKRRRGADDDRRNCQGKGEVVRSEATPGASRRADEVWCVWWLCIDSRSLASTVGDRARRERDTKSGQPPTPFALHRRTDPHPAPTCSHGQLLRSRDYSLLARSDDGHDRRTGRHALERRSEDLIQPASEQEAQGANGGRTHRTPVDTRGSRLSARLRRLPSTALRAGDGRSTFLLTSVLAGVLAPLSLPPLCQMVICSKWSTRWRPCARVRPQSPCARRMCSSSASRGNRPPNSRSAHARATHEEPAARWECT